jgi:hypothetical protein
MYLASYFNNSQSSPISQARLSMMMVDIDWIINLKEMH